MKDIKIFYCGDENRAEFLARALFQLGLTDTEIFTIDGEYHLEVRL